MSSDIPEITLKGVGKDRRDKKKGGLPLFGGGKAGGQAFKGALGGSGAAGSSGQFAAGLAAKVGTKLITKVALSLAVSAMFGGAWTIGKSMRPVPRKAARAFSDAGALKARDQAAMYGDTSKVAKPVSYQSGLAMVSGSLGGKSAEQLAAEKAAADKAAAEAAAAPAATADPQAAAAGAVPDPAAMAAAAAGAPGEEGKKKDGPFGSRFGSLSSSLGGGAGSRLSGGAGLSGGMSGKFDTGKLGAGLRGFGGNAAPTRSTARAPIRQNGGPRGLAGRQLNNAFLGSSAGARSAGTNASYLAGQPFDNGMRTDQMIADPATAPGTARPTSGAGSPGTTGGGGGSSQPNDVGYGDTYREPDDCTQILPDTFGEGVEGVTYENSPSGGCVISGGGGDASPWRDMVDIARMLTLIAGVVLMISGLLAFISSKVSWTGAGAGLWAAAVLLAKVAVAISAIIAVLGIAIAGMGNKAGGTVFALTGTAMAAAAIVAMSGSNPTADVTFKQALPKIIAGGVGMIAPFIADGLYSEPDPPAEEGEETDDSSNGDDA